MSWGRGGAGGYPDVIEEGGEDADGAREVGAGNGSPLQQNTGHNCHHFHAQHAPWLSLERQRSSVWLPILGCWGGGGCHEPTWLMCSEVGLGACWVAWSMSSALSTHRRMRSVPPLSTSQVKV